MAASTSTRSLSRDQYATIAEEILNIFKAGWYRPHRGPRVDLASDLRFSVDNTVLYTETDFDASEEERTTAASVLPTIEVRHCTTLQAARSLADEIDANRIGVLNFASAKNPGGGFLKGSNAQEESLTRSSSLYFALNQERIFTHFYRHHRHDKNGIYTHRLIYSPRVTVCKVRTPFSPTLTFFEYSFSRTTTANYYRVRTTWPWSHRPRPTPASSVTLQQFEKRWTNESDVFYTRSNCTNTTVSYSAHSVVESFKTILAKWRCSFANTCNPRRSPTASTAFYSLFSIRRCAESSHKFFSSKSKSNETMPHDVLSRAQNGEERRPR